VIRLIGQGNWADVYLAEDVTSLEKFAVKTTSHRKFNEVPKLRELVKAEITILKACRNPHVVRLVNEFSHKEHQFIVLEYCNGLELGDVLRREKKLEESTAKIYLKQILDGFRGLHEANAMHRDFKVENVMLHDGICKIVDLGFGKQLFEGDVARTKLGSNLTMAP
jgi:serine/threonine protein kinase